MANEIDAFSADLARLADLTDDELSTLESSIMAAFDTADSAGDESSMNELADALDEVRAERDKRQPPDSQEPAPAATPEAEEPATAAAVQPNETKEAKETTVASVDIPKDRAPQITEAASTVITAAADIPGYTAGTPFKSLDDFVDAFTKRINNTTRLTGGDGERVLVASIKSTVSEDRILRMNDPEGNKEKIQAVTDLSSLTASGGCCAPLTSRYDLFTIGETSRPVRDALAGFQADRGGIRFFRAPVLPGLGQASGFWDCAADEAYDPADPQTYKVCATIQCPTEETELTKAVTMCLTFGVISSRVFPENVAANTKLALVQHARLAESALLNQIKLDSTQIQGPAVSYGAVRDLLLTVARVVAWYRDRNRLDKDVPLRAILPLWLLEMMVSDLIVQPPAGDGRVADFALSNSDIQKFFTEANINVTWTLDGPSPTTNGGGTYGALVDAPDPAPAGAFSVPLFPENVQWALFPEGAWLFLDGGSLDLGIVRDSTLARSNDYMQFSEVFESAVRVGSESLWVTSPVSVRGAYSKAIA